MEGKRGPKRIIFCILPLHLTSRTGFATGRPVVPDAPKHRCAFIIRVKRSKKDRQNILLKVTITWVPVREHDFKRLAQTDITSSSYRWTSLAWPRSILQLFNEEDEGATTLRNVAIYPLTEGNIPVDVDLLPRFTFLERPCSILPYAQHNFILHSFLFLSDLC